MNKFIPYGHQSIDKKDISSVLKTLRSDFLTQGPKIKEFEDALSRYTGAKYAVAVSSGTAALHIACLAIDLKEGNEVITSPITFTASANCILYCQGKAIFVDVEKDTANIDSQEIRRKINQKTKAIISVHFSGHPCDLEAIYRIAKKYNLMIIEDAAHALGAKYKGLKIGSCKYSDMAIFSFHPIKSITTGEGGAVLTNNKTLYKRLLTLRNHGIVKGNLSKDYGPWYYEMQELGFNYRITDLQAALGISQLAKLNNFIQKRREIAQIYNRAFRNNPYFDIPEEKEYAYSSYHLYPIRLKGKFNNKRKKIFLRMRKNGLGVQVHYLPVYLHPFYKRLGYKSGLCPQAEDYYAREISIPIFPALKKKQIKFVIASVVKAFKSYA